MACINKQCVKISLKLQIVVAEKNATENIVTDKQTDTQK